MMNMPEVVIDKSCHVMGNSSFYFKIYKYVFYLFKQIFICIFYGTEKLAAAAHKKNKQQKINKKQLIQQINNV